MPRWFASVILLFLLLLFFSFSTGSEDLDPSLSNLKMDVEPSDIKIGLFYHGAKVAVTAFTSKGLDVVIRCEGPEQEMKLMRKGRVGGMWMNVEEILVEKLPAVYLLRSSAPLEEIADQETLEEHGLGYAALQARMKLHRSKEKSLPIFDDLIQLKEKDRLYEISQGNIQVSDLEVWPIFQIKSFFDLPPKVPIGTYRIDVLGFKKGAPVALGTYTLEIAKVGFVSFFSSLAANRGLLYGCVAVILAMLCGLGIGILFSSRSGH